MRTLMKIGVAMLAVATILVGLSYNVLRAEGLNQPQRTADRTIVTEVRPVTASVVNIELDGPVDLKLIQGATPSMTVRAEQRMLPKITTVQDGDTLRIDMKGIVWHTNSPLQVELTLPTLQKLSVNGSGDTVVNGFSGDQLQLALRGSGDVHFDGHYQRISAGVNGSGDLNLNGGNSDSVDLSVLGSGEVMASGQAKMLAIKLIGSGDVNANQLPADAATVDLVGSGDVTIFAKQSVTLSLKGSGDINVHGKPSQRNINRIGSGDINWE